MPKFLCKTANGTTAPKYYHTTIESAITEAKRLHLLFQDDVEILRVVGLITTEDVPITKKITMVKLESDSNELPF